MIGKPVNIRVSSDKVELPYHVHKLPDFVPLNVSFPPADLGNALPTSLRIVLSAHDSLTYDSSWMSYLYRTFYSSETDEAKADFWQRCCDLSEWVRQTFDGTFDRYYHRMISVALIESLNSDLAQACREMEAAGHPSYAQAAQHVFGVRQCLLT